MTFIALASPIHWKQRKSVPASSRKLNSNNRSFVSYYLLIA
ncbi:Uncharacterised protein [Vibrio cholerae]|nr:Uncharacterised protein [Vibrio cholerae]